jgi:hypothetical protein
MKNESIDQKEISWKDASQKIIGVYMTYDLNSTWLNGLINERGWHVEFNAKMMELRYKNIIGRSKIEVDAEN